MPPEIYNLAGSIPSNVQLLAYCRPFLFHFCGIFPLWDLGNDQVVGSILRQLGLSRPRLVDSTGLEQRPLGMPPVKICPRTAAYSCRTTRSDLQGQLPLQRRLFLPETISLPRCRQAGECDGHRLQVSINLCPNTTGMVVSGYEGHRHTASPPHRRVRPERYCASK